MIHIIPIHIGKGSWPPWYRLINFSNDEVIFHDIENSENIERKKIGEPPYYNLLLSHLDNIKINQGDCVFFDSKYITGSETTEEFDIIIDNLVKKYNCKFFIVDEDNKYEFIDTPNYTYFSNRFDISNFNNNFNFFRYRTPYHDWSKYVPSLFGPFMTTLRQKKANFIVGVDKLERLLAVKHLYDVGMDESCYIGYSGFSSNYSNESISDKLISFKNDKLPIILDTPYELSCEGRVNVEYPPFPYTLNSYVSCICETSVMDSTSVHLSEKAWNPFISHNIPLILGSKYINQYLKDLDFWLADDLFDISPKNTYIEIINQYKSNLDIINNMSINELHSYFIKNTGNLNKNYNLLMNQKFTFDRNKYK